MATAAAAPARGEPKPVPPQDPVIAAAGDIACDPTAPSYHAGEGDPTHCQQRATSELVLQMDPTAVLPLGDQQYPSGEFDKFQASYDPTWGRFKAISHPVVGNHEYFTPGAAGYFDYFNGPGAFGGPAGDRDKGWYSFDLGAWHLIALSSSCSQIGGCGPGSPEEQWLRADLAAHQTSCTLAYWHHPLFTSGGSGWTSMRPIWRALYDAGADLVLNGHEHAYERFGPKDAFGAADPQYGIRELIVGTGGEDFAKFHTSTPKSEVRNDNTFGVLKLTLHPEGYDWQFVPVPGGSFTDSGSGACHGAPPPKSPAVETGSAYGHRGLSARLTAAVDPNGQATTYHFEYGPTTAYGSATPDATVASPTGGPQQVTAEITGLEEGASYHYRLVATNATGTTTGGDRSFGAERPGRYEGTILRTPGLLSYWRLDEPGGGNVFDARGASLGSLTPGSRLDRRGALVAEASSATGFDGTTGELTAYGPAVSEALTIEGWFRWTRGNVLMRDDSNLGGWIAAYKRGSRLGYRVAGSSFSTSRTIDSVRDGAWHYMALTKQGGFVAFYLDGQRIGTAYGVRSTPPTMPWHVMRNGPFDDHAGGRVDELAIYDAPLPSRVVKQHYKTGVLTPPETLVEGPAGRINDRSPTLAFVSNKRRARFRCMLVGPRRRSPLGPCPSSLRLHGLPDGSYHLIVYAISRDGHPDPRLRRRYFAVDTVPPTISTSVAPEPLRYVLRHGVRLTVTCSEACATNAKLWLGARLARRLKLAKHGRAVVGTLVRPLRSAGTHSFRLRFTRVASRRLRRMRSVTLTLRGSAKDAVGNARGFRLELKLGPPQPPAPPPAPAPPPPPSG